MTVVTLLEKAYGPFPPAAFEPTFSSLCIDLKVSLKVLGKTDRGWIQIEVSGEDETAALNYLDQTVGFAPASLDKSKELSTLRGKIIFSGKSKNELCVDVGLFAPVVVDATIRLQSLQAQLASGKALPLHRLIEAFCLYDHMPLSVKIVGGVDPSKKQIEAELSEAQLSQFMRWVRSCLDRLIVLGATLSDVEHAIKASRHSRDIVKVETLGLLEHAILCKLGTDAVGLIPKLGPLLPTATLAPFCPRKVEQLIDRPFL